MGSTIVSASSYISHSDVGFIQTELATVRGYDIEDLVRDKAISIAMGVWFMNLGKQIDPTMPTSARSMESVWRNNEIDLS